MLHKEVEQKTSLDGSCAKLKFSEGKKDNNKK